MISVATTKMSSKGQIVIPESIRSSLGWGSGTSFTVVIHHGAVIMQPLRPPSRSELSRRFNEVLKRTQRQAAEAGMTKDDIAHAISSYRAERHKTRIVGNA